MRNILVTFAAVLMFTVSPVFSASSPSLKEVGMFADEHVGNTFTFDAYITTDRVYFRDSVDDNGNYGIILCDENQKSLTKDHVMYAIDNTNLYTTIYRKQAKELLKTLDSSMLYKRRITFKVTKEQHKGHPYYSGKIISIKNVNKTDTRKVN